MLSPYLTISLKDVLQGVIRVNDGVFGLESVLLTYDLPDHPDHDVIQLFLI